MAQRYGDLSKAPGMGLIIGSVRVLGNKKTKTATILIAARVPLGKPLTAEMVQRIQRDVLSAGYVRSVDVNWEISKDRKDTLCLFLVVKEKISWFVAPYFSYTEGQYGGSIAFGDRNLLGTGKQLRFYLGYNTESQRVSIRYKDPNIFFTPWYWATMADYTRSVFKDYDPSKAAMRRGSLLRVQTFQRFTTELEAGYRWYHWVTTGIRYRFGLVDTERPHCLRASPLGERVFQRCPTSPADLDPALLGVSWYVGPEALLDDNGQWVDHTSHRAKFWKWRRDAGIVLLPELSRMHIIHGMEHGFSVAGHLSVNHRYLGGSFNYVTWKTEYDHALSFGRNPLFGARHNLRWHVEHGQNHNAPYFRDLRVGGTDLRGFISQQFSGDSLTRSTLEYKVHMFTVGWLMFRAVAFWDSAWVFFRKAGGKDALVQERDERRRFHLPYSPGPMDLRSWHNSLGTGLRIYIKGLSVGTVGVDVAYGIDVNKVRFVVTLGN